VSRIIAFFLQYYRAVHVSMHTLTGWGGKFYHKAPVTRSAPSGGVRQWQCASVCLSVRLSVAGNAVFTKTKQFRAMVSIDHRFIYILFYCLI